MSTRLLAFALCLLWATVVGAGALPALAESHRPAFQPPSTPVTITRTLYRPLADGEQIIVRRRYEVRFSLSEDGYQLDGRLMGTSVDSPARLASLAELEKARPDTGLFPILLDQNGMILTTDTVVADRRETQQAMADARTLLAASLPAKRQHETAIALTAIAEAMADSSWPPFLFNPGPDERSAVHNVTMADGSIGQVKVTIRSEQLAPGNLPQRIERTITTRLLETERSTREVWTLDF